MTRGTTPKLSLARHNARLLTLVFSVFLLTVAIAGGSLLMAPMARRSADDLAGLMLLSAQTWSELPPATRADFEVELARSHWLSLRDPGPARQGPIPGADEWHGFYVYALETALAHKTGHRQHLAQETRDGEAWLWATLPSGEGSIAVGFPARRVGTQPLRTLLITLGAGLLLAILTAIWLARRISGPLARLEKATSAIGRGEIPDPLPETGPRELAALAAHFNRMARQVRELLAVRTTLMAGVSHDLRTPLARMRLALALLAEKPSPRLIARLEQDIGEMDQLIGKVLDLARGLENEAAEDFELGNWLAKLANVYPTGRVRYAPHPEPLLLHLPPLALRRVLENLLDNALRYGDNQPIDLVLEGTGTAVRIGVLDRGPGIPAGQTEAVFQPFYRVDGSRSPVNGGAGLGLAIVRQLTTTHGWRVQLQPREGGGLEAWLTLSLTP
ncbi:MAG: HAMP domain-containing protein [Chromatiaceae bacterium]|nr:HAMP domain-containing protein [Chromatiaceae bacterium]